MVRGPEEKARTVRRRFPAGPIDFTRSPNHHAPMIAPILQVAAGGAIGAVMRYLAGIGLVRLFGHTAFPLGVLTVNVLGSFAMGLFVGLAAQRGLTHLSPFVATGILGGFTTFSAFSLEAVTLYERGAVGLAAAYVIMNVVCSIAALFAGLALSRSLAA
jgi:CrcB protein